MFEKDLEEKLTRIFKLKRVEFSPPSESQEQGILFVQIDRANSKVRDTEYYARVTGRLSAFADAEKMPHGYFARCIAKAEPADTKDFFFSEIDESAGTIKEIDVRTASFTFIFSSQFDPDQGTINSINLDTEVTE
jgi:hypothetical protein